MFRAPKLQFPRGGRIISTVLVAAVVAGAGPNSVAKIGDGRSAIGPLIARGYVEAPDGTVAVGGDPGGGAKVRHLRIEEGQSVRKGDVIAVLSEFPNAEAKLRQHEAQLAKAHVQRKAILSGFRTTEIRLQEISVESAIAQTRVKALDLARSSKPPSVQELELSLSHRDLERQRLKLRLLKAKLETDASLNAVEIERLTTFVEHARLDCEAALVRAPINGVVVQIFAREGEYVDPKGLFRIVDMSQLRVLADVDDLHRGRVVVGGKVEIVLSGSKTIHLGTIVRSAFMVKRMQLNENYTSSSPNSRLVEVQIRFDDLASVPQLFGREARVTFL